MLLSREEKTNRLKVLSKNLSTKQEVFLDHYYLSTSVRNGEVQSFSPQTSVLQLEALPSSEHTWLTKVSTKGNEL